MIDAPSHRFASMASDSHDAVEVGGGHHSSIIAPTARSIGDASALVGGQVLLVNGGRTCR